MKRFIYFSVISFLVICFAESDLEKWKKSVNKEKENYQNNINNERKKYETYLNQERKKWQQHIKEIRKKWGKIETETPKKIVKYSNDYKSKSIIDFENNKIRIEVIEDNEKNIENKIDKNFNKLLNLTNGKNKLLSQQIAYKNNPVTSYNRKKYLKEHIKNGKYQNLKGSDNKKRRAYVIELDLVPNSIQIRAKKYLNTVKKYSQKYNIDPVLVMAIIHTESAFNPKAYSRRPDGTPMACGLMQIIPTMAGRDAYRGIYGRDKIVKPDYLFQSDENIKMGCWYLRWLRRWWEKQERKDLGKISSDQKIEYYVISSYNQGMGLIKKRAYKPQKLYKSSQEKTYQTLTTNTKIPHEGRDYLMKVNKRKKLYTIK